MAFDLVPVEEKQAFKQKLDEQIHESILQGVDHIWYVSAPNPNKFPHWLLMVDLLANYPENVVEDYDSIDYVVYE
jgi:hypothetical protein